MKYVTLNNGVEMPILGFGVFQILDPKECEESVYNALMKGYRLIDTAAVYENEEAVGKAMKRSGIPRKEIFLTTKVWIQDFGYEKTKKAFQASIDRLGVDYLDLYLIHMPYGDYYGAWRAMEELYQEGKIRAIGVCNFEGSRIVDLILHSKVVPAVNQIEYHPFNHQQSIVDTDIEHKVQTEAWAPLAQGHDNIFQNPILAKIGQKYGKTPAQVILRWDVQNNIVTIPKSVHKERIEQNFDIWDFELTPEDMETVNALESNFYRNLDLRSKDTVIRLSAMKFHD